MTNTPTPPVGRFIHDYSSVEGARMTTPQSTDRQLQHVERRCQVLYTNRGGRPYVVPYRDI
jgi:hypothetical protein